MRSLGRVPVILLFMLSSAPPPPASAATDTLAGLAGRWHCAVAGQHAAERYYYLFASTAADGARTLYGRQETVERDGEPSQSFERIAQRSDRSASIEAFEGSGNATAGDAAPLRFTSSFPGADFALSYAVDGDTMQRVATYNGRTIDSERCTRVPEKPFDTSCAHPNVPAATLLAAEPEYPAAAIPKKASGLVHLSVTLDEHSRVIWSEVVKSDNHLFDEEAVRAARLSTYRTEIRNCRPIAKTYIFTVEFSYGLR
jgi:TonB family protein